MKENQYQLGRSFLVAGLCGTTAALVASVGIDSIGMQAEFNSALSKTVFVSTALLSIVSDTERAKSPNQPSP